ncbi:MAG: hypothetical protein JWM95_1243 [Gemmatimonadetes bacterium]|nr:hypothetical protein [Gemmatimonadota bacterium]
MHSIAAASPGARLGCASSSACASSYLRFPINCWVARMHCALSAGRSNAAPTASGIRTLRLRVMVYSGNRYG